jgi:hypothetical protein
MVQDSVHGGGSVSRNVLLAAVAVLLFVALCIAAWFGYWALKETNVDKQYKVNTNTQQYQAGLISQERDAVMGWNTAVDPGQKDLIKTTFCTQYLNLTQPPADLVFAQSKICAVP